MANIIPVSELGLEAIEVNNRHISFLDTGDARWVSFVIKNMIDGQEFMSCSLISRGIYEIRCYPKVPEDGHLERFYEEFDEMKSVVKKAANYIIDRLIETGIADYGDEERPK